MHKNKNEAKGNFAIYVLGLFDKIHKVGKADAERVTQSSGNPTRIHDQIRKLGNIFGAENVFVRIVRILFDTTTLEAKNEENNVLDKIIQKTGEVPEGNKKSYGKNKKK